MGGRTSQCAVALGDIVTSSGEEFFSVYWQSMNIVLFHPDEIDSPLPLADPRAQHLRKVLRKEPGDSFVAGIVNGPAGEAEIIALDGEGLRLQFTATSDGMPLHPVGLVIGFPRPIQLKRLLRDVASLGVREVHLCGTELGEKSYLKSTLSQESELAAMLQDGSIQARSTHVPAVFVHRDVAACLDALGRDGTIREATSIPVVGNSSIKVALDNVAPACSLNSFLSGCGGGSELRSRGVVAAIGSERGWTAAERDLFRGAGFTLCGMGQRVLRTETAATTATAIILSHMEIL